MKILNLILTMVITLFCVTSLSWSACDGDTDCDGDVDGVDVANVAADFGTVGCGPCETLWQQSGFDIYYNDGNVGIGTDSPQAKLEVSGGETNLQQEAWQAVTFQNGWYDLGGGFSPTGYFKDSMGIVHLRGVAMDYSSTSNVIFTLPEGYRPAYRELHVVITASATLGRIDIISNGNVTLQAGASGTSVSLDGITFRAAD